MIIVAVIIDPKSGFQTAMIPSDTLKNFMYDKMRVNLAPSVNSRYMAYQTLTSSDANPAAMALLGRLGYDVGEAAENTVSGPMFLFREDGEEMRRTDLRKLKNMYKKSPVQLAAE